MVIWIIGLAGSGKTVIGETLYSLLKKKNKATVFLDGDGFRECMNNDLGHTIADREKNGWRICKLCQLLDRQHIDVVCAILSLFSEQRAWCRENFSHYFEVYLEVSNNTLFSRDKKHLYSSYKKGAASNVVGLDITFSPPENPDLVLTEDMLNQSLSKITDMILAELKETCYV